MDEKNEDVAHTPNATRASQNAGFQADFLIRHRHVCVQLAGGELDQIHFLLGHVSIQTAERYLGCKQKLRIAVNDEIVSSLPKRPDPAKGRVRSPLVTTRE